MFESNLAVKLDRVFLQLTLGVELLSGEQPLGKFCRGFQGQRTQCPSPKIMNQNLRRFLQLDPLARLQCAALAPYGLEQRLFSKSRRIGQFVAQLQSLRVVGLEVVEQLERHLFLAERIAPDRAAGGQVVAALGHDDAWPQQARCVVQIEVIRQRDALLQLGDAGLVAGFGGTPRGQGIDQG